MLFYEPLFLTIFPAFYAFYLLATGASAKKWTLLVASTLFYIWGEPVFVLVLLVSTAIDYALSFHLNDPTPARTRRLALGAGQLQQFLVASAEYLRDRTPLQADARSMNRRQVFRFPENRDEALGLPPRPRDLE